MQVLDLDLAQQVGRRRGCRARRASGSRAPVSDSIHARSRSPRRDHRLHAHLLGHQRRVHRRPLVGEGEHAHRAQLAPTPWRRCGRSRVGAAYVAPPTAPFRAACARGTRPRTPQPPGERSMSLITVLTTYAVVRLRPRPRSDRGRWQPAGQAQRRARDGRAARPVSDERSAELHRRVPRAGRDRGRAAPRRVLVVAAEALAADRRRDRRVVVAVIVLVPGLSSLRDRFNGAQPEWLLVRRRAPALLVRVLRARVPRASSASA